MCSVCCEVAVQSKTVDDYILTLKPLLDLILEPKIFDKTVVISSLCFFPCKVKYFVVYKINELSLLGK